MTQQHDILLQKICEELDRIVEANLPDGLTPADVRVNVRFSTDKNPLGDHIRLLGNTIMICLRTLSYDTLNTTIPGQRGVNRGAGDKFLGIDPIWVNVEHLGIIYPGKDMVVNGQMTPTCYVSLIEEHVYRVAGTCEEFIDSIHYPLVEYAESAYLNPSPSPSHHTPENEKKVEIDEANL